MTGERIPESLKMTARELLVSLSDDREPDTQADVEKVVTVLMAERERAAKIVLAAADVDFSFEAAEHVAAAIRA